MMTPVYSEAITNWNTNSCDTNDIAARLDLSCLFNTSAHTNHTFSAAAKHLVYNCFNHLKKSLLQILHLWKRERQKYLFHSINEPQSLSNSYCSIFLQAIESYQNRSKNIFFSSNVISIIYHRLTTTGTDVLWQQKRFDLKVTNCESNVLDGYIKEQPAGHPTTANDEEK